MKIEIAEIDDVTTLILDGALVDPGPVAELHLTVNQLLKAGRKRLAIDTRKVRVADTPGMAEIFDCTRRAKQAGAELSLITSGFEDGRVVTRVFELVVRLESLRTVEDGIKACSGRRRAMHD